MRTLERCSNERVDREVGKIVYTVEDRIQNAVFSAIGSTSTPKIELVFSSINAPSGRDATSVMVSLELGENIEITAFFENVSGKNNTLHVVITNDETRNKIPDEVSELSVTGTYFTRQPHTHHMVTRQTAQINQIPEFLTRRTLTPREQQSHQHQNLSTQVSYDISLPMVEHTPKKSKFILKHFQ